MNAALVTALVVAVSSDPGTPVVVSDAPADAGPLLGAELSALGFRVVVESCGVELVACARRVGADLVVGFGPGDGGAQIQVADLRGQQATRLWAPIDPAASGRVLALQALELVQAVVEAAPPETSAAPAPIRAAARPREPKLALGLAAGAWWSPGGMGVQPMLLPSLRWMFHRRVGAELSGQVPLRTVRIDGPEGDADVVSGAVSLGLRIPFRGEQRTVQLDGAVAGGLFVSRMAGRAREPYVSRVDHVSTPMVSARLGMAVALRSRVRWNLDGWVAVLVPPITVRFGDRDAARQGAPFVGVTTGVSFLAP